jgi:hypothetical protein
VNNSKGNEKQRVFKKDMMHRFITSKCRFIRSNPSGLYSQQQRLVFHHHPHAVIEVVHVGTALSYSTILSNSNNNNNNNNQSHATTTTAPTAPTTTTTTTNLTIPTPSPPLLPQEEEKQDDKYVELMHEYKSIKQDIVPSLTKHLYRYIMRSIYKQLQYGNVHDYEDFEKREQQQVQHRTTRSSSSRSSSSSSSTSFPRYNNSTLQQPTKMMETNTNTAKITTAETSISLIDTIPVDRQDELHSRMQYYCTYAKEGFTSYSDVLDQLIKPLPKTSKVHPYAHPSSRTSHYDNNNTPTPHSDPTHYFGISYMAMKSAELDHGINSTGDPLLQYSSKKDEQYKLIQRYMDTIQQGYIQHDWLLRDMKFNPTTTNSSTKKAGQTMRSTINRIQTNMSKINFVKQQEMQVVKSRLERYVDDVLEYNYKEAIQNRMKGRESSIHTLTIDIDVPFLLSSGGGGSSNNDIDEDIDFWNEEDDD